MRAGEAALRRGAWTEARRLFRSALVRRQTPEALEGLGWAEWWLDRPRASFAARERAYALYRRGRDRRAAARVAVALGSITSTIAANRRSAEDGSSGRGRCWKDSSTHRSTAGRCCGRAIGRGSSNAIPPRPLRMGDRP